MIYQEVEIHKVMHISYKKMIRCISGMEVHGLTVVLFKVHKVQKVLQVQVVQKVQQVLLVQKVIQDQQVQMVQTVVMEQVVLQVCLV